MKRNKQIISGTVLAFGMLILILDARTAMLGAREGIALCLYTVVPSLFPFIILSILINSRLSVKCPVLLRPVGKLCRMPAGSEMLLVLGLLGGYPVGAQNISQSYNSGRLGKRDAERLLGYCSNAGPAFIFGMSGSLFSSPVVPWVVWAVQILSAIAVGILLPGGSQRSSSLTPKKSIRISQALERGLQITAFICGWVILFRIVIAFSSRWFLWLFPPVLQNLFFGVLELANGCTALQSVASEGLRFICCCCFLSFGGVCVAMQTASVTTNLRLGTYYRGKILQCIIGFILSASLQPLLFSGGGVFPVSIPFILLAAVAVYLLSGRLSFKKGVAIAQ